MGFYNNIKLLTNIIISFTIAFVKIKKNAYQEQLRDRAL